MWCLLQRTAAKGVDYLWALLQHHQRKLPYNYQEKQTMFIRAPLTPAWCAWGRGCTASRGQKIPRKPMSQSSRSSSPLVMKVPDSSVHCQPSHWREGFTFIYFQPHGWQKKQGGKKKQATSKRPKCELENDGENSTNATSSGTFDIAEIKKIVGTYLCCLALPQGSYSKKGASSQPLARRQRHNHGIQKMGRMVADRWQDWSFYLWPILGWWLMRGVVKSSSSIRQVPSCPNDKDESSAIVQCWHCSQWPPHGWLLVNLGWPWYPLLVQLQGLLVLFFF